MSPPSISDPIGRFLSQQGFLVLDGGLATELERSGVELHSNLWSAATIVDVPHVVANVHEAYLSAGADCITAATYQATIEGFIEYGLSRVDAVQSIAVGVDLARRARDRFWESRRDRGRRICPIVAASVGPYGAFLANGAEYTGDYDLGEDELLDFHQERWRILADSGSDLLACETIPSRKEARALNRLIATGDRPAWISFTCRNSVELADGESLAETVYDLRGTPNLLAVGINCVQPGLVTEAVRTMRSVWPGPIVAYPNSGDRWDAKEKRWLRGTQSSETFAAAGEWVTAGARILGGCCQTGPADIEALRHRLTELRQSGNLNSALDASQLG